MKKENHKVEKLIVVASFSSQKMKNILLYKLEESNQQEAGFMMRNKGMTKWLQ